MRENDVWVRPDPAKTYALQNGAYVSLKNQDNIVSNRVRVRVIERIRPDCMYMVPGFGHTSMRFSITFSASESDSRLITKYATDPLMDGTGMNVNFATFELEET